MKKVLFLITELEKPAGGLHRFVKELLPAWRNAAKRGRTEFEPLVVSLHDPNEPLGDLVPAKEFEEVGQKNGFKVFSAERGGEKCFFIESSLSDGEYYAFHRELWDKYRIKSEKSSPWPFYRLLCGFWKHAPILAGHLAEKGEKTVLADAQDWLAFPAGFLAKEMLGIPLYCRFHSCEYGRSMGSVDHESAPELIEAAALQEADMIQGVSVSEAKFVVYHLLSLKKRIREELEREKGGDWAKDQERKEDRYEDFLLLETSDLELIGENASGLTNGIILDDWKNVSLAQIQKGREILKKLADKKHYILFIGRVDIRKGIDQLLEAMALLERDDTLLVLSSSFTDADYEKYSQKIKALGITDKVAINSGWLDEPLKKGLFCASDVICLPSLYEPFGLVTLEGLAADLACENNRVTGPAIVVGATGGMNEIIKNGQNGFKVPMDEDKFDMRSDYLAKIIEMVLRNDNLRRRLSRGGAERVQSPYFDWNFIVLRMHESYHQAVENYKHSFHAGKG